MSKEEIEEKIQKLRVKYRGTPDFAMRKVIVSQARALKKVLEHLQNPQNKTFEDAKSIFS